MSFPQARLDPNSPANLDIKSRRTSVNSENSNPKVQSPPTLDQHNTNNDELLNDRITLLFIRRILCTQPGDKGRSGFTSIDEILPPLTSSNEVDLQLYAFIAIIIREYVQAWYYKITSDQIFVEELIKILAHCTRALEERFRKIDLETLLFDELPELLECHIKVYKASHLALHPPPIAHEPRQIFHSLWPFAPLTPVPNDQDQELVQQQSKNESAYRRILAQGIVAILLPPEELGNNCFTSLIIEILSELVLGVSIGGNVSEPWLLLEGITKISETINVQMSESSQVRTQQTEQCTIDIVDSDSEESTKKRSIYSLISQSLQGILWFLFKYGFLLFMTMHYSIITYISSSNLPCRNSPRARKLSAQLDDEATSFLSDEKYSKRPILSMKIWSCLGSLLELENRMPWLNATLSMLQWMALAGPGEIGQTDKLIDKKPIFFLTNLRKHSESQIRVLSHAIHTHILVPSYIPKILCAFRSTMFPNNMLAPSRQAPDVAEYLLIRRRCAESIVELMPKSFQEVYFGSETVDVVREVEECLLCYFEDSYCNKHLLYSIIELILLKLMPELTKSGVQDLLGERLN